MSLFFLSFIYYHIISFHHSLSFFFFDYSIGYVTFPDDFIKQFKAATSEEEAVTILNNEIKPMALNYVDVCYKTTNASAKAAGRTNTAARIIWEATDDSKYDIDPVYGFDLPIKTACWERALNGDVNEPVYDYSQQLLKQFHWDKAYAEAYLQEQHKRFKPATST